jgi:hypothetical protein
VHRVSEQSRDRASGESPNGVLGTHGLLNSPASNVLETICGGGLAVIALFAPLATRLDGRRTTG